MSLVGIHLLLGSQKCALERRIANSIFKISGARRSDLPSKYSKAVSVTRLIKGRARVHAASAINNYVNWLPQGFDHFFIICVVIIVCTDRGLNLVLLISDSSTISAR